MYNTHTDVLLAGAIAAFSVDVLVYPLDTLKTRFQSPDYTRLYTDASTKAVNRPVLFRGLYQGLGSVVVATLPASGAFFTTYEASKSFLATRTALPTPLAHATASSVAELVSCLILTPAEVIKQNAQMVQSPSSAANATLETLRRFRARPRLWSGYGALAARNLPFTALQFPLFERARASILASGRYENPSLAQRGLITAISAGGAGALAAALTTPVDVVKTRIMLAASSSSSPSSSDPIVAKETKRGGPDRRGRSPGGWAVARAVVRTSGVRGLFRGGTLRGVWTALGSGLYLGVYDCGCIWLGERRQGRHADGERIA
ncbi:MAG: hypothetical protein M1832_005207 [Thelocarpon impressellum]|nr:MAG: hypothetical protein M1832_005207 [Thelocarpon impressellum]